jgi:hypothetical protein
MIMVTYRAIGSFATLAPYAEIGAGRCSNNVSDLGRVLIKHGARTSPIADISCGGPHVR